MSVCECLCVFGFYFAFDVDFGALDDHMIQRFTTKMHIEKHNNDCFYCSQLLKIMIVLYFFFIIFAHFYYFYVLCGFKCA